MIILLRTVVALAACGALGMVSWMFTMVPTLRRMIPQLTIEAVSVVAQAGKFNIAVFPLSSCHATPDSVHFF